MKLSVAALGFVWSLVLAISVVAVAARVPPRDSARAGWIATESPPWMTLVASEDSGTVARERSDLVRQLAALGGLDRGVAFDAALGANVTLAAFALFIALTAWGTAPGWSLAAVAMVTVWLQSLARLGHPTWLLAGGLVLLVIALLRFARQPSAVGAALLAGSLLLSWSTSALCFHVATITLAGWAVMNALFSRAHAMAALALGTGVLVLHAVDLAFGPVPPSAAKSLAAVPFAYLGRAWILGLEWSEIAAFMPFFAAAASSFLVERRHRTALIVAALLLWASLGPHTPALPILGRPPPLRLFHWAPSGDEFGVPLLLAVAAASIVVAVGARYLSSVAPAGLGLLLALGIAVVPGRVLEQGWPSSEAGIDVTGELGSPRLLVWPLDFVTLERVARGTPRPQRFVNLEPVALDALAELLPPRPNLLWSERFVDVVAALGIDTMVFVAPPPPLPEWAFRADGDDRYRLEVEAAKERFAGLRLLESEGWTARSSARGANLPESNAFDGRRDTRWGSGEAQRPGQFLELDFGRAVSAVTRIVLDPGRWESDWPRALVVEGSADGMTWREIAADPRPAVDARRVVIDFAPESLRGIRLVQQGRDRSLDWSIAELGIWREPRS